MKILSLFLIWLALLHGFRNVQAESHSFLTTCSHSQPLQECPDTYFYSDEKKASENLEQGWNTVSDTTELEAFYTYLGLERPPLCWEINNDHCHKRASDEVSSQKTTSLPVSFRSEAGEQIHYVQPSDSSGSATASDKKILATVTIALSIAFAIIPTYVWSDPVYLVFLAGIPITCFVYYLSGYIEEKRKTYF